MINKLSNYQIIFNINKFNPTIIKLNDKLYIIHNILRQEKAKAKAKAKTKKQIMTETNLTSIINKLRIPKVILRYIMMNFLDLTTINNLLLSVKEMNVLDDYSKDLISKAQHHGFDKNCIGGHLAVAQWLYAHSNEKVNIHANNEYIFKWTCANGQLAVAQWLYSLDNININIHADNDFAFIWACAYGHNTVAKWLYELEKPTRININGYCDCAFRWACLGGHLITAQWLYELGVNIHADDEYAFRYACQNGHLSTAQWLYGLNAIIDIIDIHAANDFSFTQSSGETLKWLNSLKPKINLQYIV